MLKSHEKISFKLMFVLLFGYFGAASAITPGQSPLIPAGPDPIYFGPKLCENASFECIKVQNNESWEKKFPDENQRDLVQRLNRTYNRLYPGQLLVLPKDLAKATLLDLAPFPHQISDHEKQIIVDQDKLAWAAYNSNGELVKWGPIASGRDKCPDSANSCRTLTGMYRIFSKEGPDCQSDIFPIGRGGAKMPYCMFFHKGYALHGSEDIPGYRASHGCVRMFTRDAKWLNYEFAESDHGDSPGTKVVNRPVSTPSTYGR